MIATANTATRERVNHPAANISGKASEAATDHFAIFKPKAGQSISFKPMNLVYVALTWVLAPLERGQLLVNDFLCRREWLWCVAQQNDDQVFRRHELMPAAESALRAAVVDRSIAGRALSQKP